MECAIENDYALLIKKMRLMKNLNRQEASKLFSFSDKYIERLENNRARITIERFEEFKKGYMVSDHEVEALRLGKLEFGERGKKTLERLEELKLLKFEKGHFFFNESLNATQETVHKLVLNLLTNSYDLDNFGPARNMLTLQYESVDKEKVLPKLRAIIDRARAETRELFNDPENKGQDVVWVTYAGDTLGPHGHTVKEMTRQGELQ